MAEPGLDLSATVLKLPHHGSRHSWSDDFMERVDPVYAVISVGSRNPFGHPSPEVLAGARERVRIFVQIWMALLLLLLGQGYQNPHRALEWHPASPPLGCRICLRRPPI